MTGNTSDPTSYKVNFFTKIADGSYAVFDNTSAAIKNRTYMSTKIMDILSKTDTLKNTEGQKAHMIAKRFGDQSQAEVTCDHAIPYLYKDGDEIVSDTSNGKHLFVTKDRIAVVAALSYGAPMVLHIKSGNPKDKLHNILYINNELIEIPDDAKEELITEVEAYNDDQSTNEVIFDASSTIARIKGRFAEFSGLLEKSPEKDFIKYVENISAATITCMALDRFKQDIEDTKTIIDMKIVTPVGLGNDEDYNRMRKQLTEFRLKEGTLGKLITDADAFISRNLFLAPIPTSPTGSWFRPRRNSTPSNLKELRFAWTQTNNHISTISITDAEQFTRGCIRRCPAILQNTADEDKIYSLLTGQVMEIIRTPDQGFAPKRVRGGGSETINATDVQDVQQRPANRQFFGSGVVGGSSLPVDIMRPFQVAIRDKDDWTIGLPKNELGQIMSTQLIDTRFAIAVLAIIYDSPGLIYLKYHQAKVFVDEYLRTTPDQGFAPSRQVEQPDDEKAINNLHTEISYLHRYVTDASPKLEFKARVLDILWNIRGNKTKELFEPNRWGWITPAEDNVYHAETETDEELDPIVQVNEYARSILGTIDSDEDEINPKEGTIPNSNSSLRIRITAAGFIDERCGFFINCVKPILYIEDSSIKRLQTTKSASAIAETQVVKPISFLGL